MKKALVPLAIVFAAIALVACGGDDDDESTQPTPAGGAEKTGGGGTTLKLEADPDGALAYTTDQLNAKAGSLTIDLDNPAPVSHNVAVESPAGEDLGASDTVAEDKTSLELADLKPGKYTFYCSVPGHREGGMEGTLTVK